METYKDMYRKGDIVVFTSSLLHKAYPQWYPKPGVSGVITDVGNTDCVVLWERGSTSKDDSWFVRYEHIRHAYDEDDISSTIDGAVCIKEIF